MIYKKNRFLIRFMTLLALSGLVVFLAGCGGGLPKGLKTEAKSLPSVIKTGSSQVDTLQKKYQRLASSSEFREIERFAVKENWNQKFDLARDELKRASTLYDKDLKPLLSKNKIELAPQVKKEIIRIKSVLKDAERLSRYPASRFLKIKKTIQDIDDLQARAKTDADQISRIAGDIKTNALAKALTDFPDLTDKINARFSPLSKLEAQSRGHLDVVTTVYDRHTGGADADYAAFTDSSEALYTGREQAKILQTRFTREMAQLYTSYTKILKDMKEDLFVTIKRESWNENSDYYDPQYATFERQVSPEAYEALTADNLDSIAAITAGFFGSKFSTAVDGKVWKELSINPTEMWPGRGHNAASFWVENTREAYYHKYLLEENGETRETGWEKVDASVYDANFEYLGMAILAKPYGVFETEQLTQAAPPGMAYVGNSKYGEWKKDNSGSSFWSWYGKYAMFSMLFNSRRSYFGYNSWNSWNTNYRNQKPYFGKTQTGSQKFGTYGTDVKKSPRFQNTNFAKSGGFRSQAASVRGAGPNLRGGGPKSKGK